MAKQNKGRKFFAASATAALVASAIVPVASAAQVNDYNKISGYAKDAVQALVDQGVIQGDTNGNFNPLNTVTRAQAAEIFTKALELEADGEVNFKDVKAGAWYYNSIAAVVANGIFEGVSANEFAPNKSLTRSEAAKVLVDAFGLEGSESLGQFADASQVKPWAKTALETAVANGIFTGSEENGKLNLKPNAAITRQDFAVVFARTLDLVDTETPADASVKAINNTTVEVTFDEEVTDVKALDFAIEGLEVKNAAIKQTNKKVVVLTTSAQTADKEYTVTLDGKKIGSFKGVSTVIPTKVVVETDVVQGIVGQQVTLKADIGVKEANVPVTFNVKAAINSLNKDQVEEVLTDANGIATFTYTQYNAGFSDEVAAYASGAPAVRDFASVHWGVDTILKIEANDKKTNELTNGENKVYKVTYKDPKTGKPVEGKKLNVTFAENVDVEINKITHAKANGKTPYQTTSGKLGDVVEIVTDSKGEAILTVSGTNTKATPVVFFDGDGSTASKNNKLDRTELKVKADELTFGAIHLKYEMEVTRDGGEEAAVGSTNGRVYKVAVKDENGKVAAGEVVNVALEEVLDKVISTNTDARFLVNDSNAATSDRDADLAGKSKFTNSNDKQQITLELNSKGEGEFRIVNADDKGYATPVVWIDINTASNKDGVLEETEPKKVAAMTYFAQEKIAGSALKVLEPGTTNSISDRTIEATKGAEFKFNVANQSGKAISAARVNGGKANFQVSNTGTKDVIVFKTKTHLDNYLANPTQANANEGTIVSTRRGETITIDNIPTSVNSASIYVASVGGESASVDVTAYGEFKDQDNKFVNLSESKVAKAAFKSASAILDSYEGIVTSFSSTSKKIKLGNKDEIEFKAADADGKVKYYYVSANGAKVTTGFEHFSTLVADYTTKDIKVAYYKDSTGNIEFTVIDSAAPTNTVAGTLVVANGAGVVNAAPATTLLGGLTFTSSPGTDLNGFNVVAGTVADGTTASASLTDTTITINGDFSNDDAASNFSTVVDLQAAIDALTLPNGATVTVTGTPGVIPANAKSVAFAGGVAAAPAKAEVATFTVTSGARVAGDITVTLTNPAVTATVAVAAGDDAAAVANKIRTVLGANATVTADYTVSGTGADVVFTSTTTGDVTNLTVVITN